MSASLSMKVNLPLLYIFFSMEWTEAHDVRLCHEILHDEPCQRKKGSNENLALRKNLFTSAALLLGNRWHYAYDMKKIDWFLKCYCDENTLSLILPDMKSTSPK